MPLASSPALAAEIGPYLAGLLKSREASIVANVHPMVARWEASHVLTAIEKELPTLADHLFGWIAAKLRDSTVGELVTELDRLIATSEYRPGSMPGTTH